MEKNIETVRVVSFQQFKADKSRKIKTTIDLDKKTILFDEVVGIDKEKIQSSLEKFIPIEEVNDKILVNKWWKYTHPVWWVVEITKLPFFIFRQIGFSNLSINKIEKSFIGKIIRWIIGGIVVFGTAILPILNAFGYQEGFVNFIKSIF